MKGYFMELTRQILKEYSSYLKNVKYKGIVQDIKLEHCTDIDDNNINEDDHHIILRIIRIRKSQRNKGFGSIVLSDVINLADSYNVRLILYASEKYGSNIQGLYKFYLKHNFVLIKNDSDKKMIHYPNVQLNSNSNYVNYPNVNVQLNKY
jgi:GNAT superfamily N-acetyltransferase